MNVVVIAFALALALGQAPESQPTQPTQLAQVQPPPAQPRIRESFPALTLEDALTRAASENLDLRAAQARLDQANTVSRQVWSGQLPQVSATGRYTRNEEEVELPVSATEVVTIQALNQWNAQVDASQVLFAPGLWLAIRNAYRTEGVAAANVEAAQRDILFGVAQSYYAVASLLQAVEVADRLLEIAQRQEKDARVRYQAGAIPKVGLLRAEIDRARAEQDVRRAVNQYESAKVGLATLLNRDTAFDVVDPPDPQLTGTVEELEGRAVRARPELRAAGLNVDIARNERTQLATDYLPTVAAFGTYQWSNSGGLAGQDAFWVAGLTASWNIFDGGLREARISEAGARIAEFEATRASTANNVRTEVRQAWLDHESARANAIKAREQRDLAAENLRLVDVSYRAGAATAVELADATAQLRTAEIAVTTEELQAQLAALRVLRAAGEFHPAPRK